MQLGAILSPEAIACGLKPTSKKRLFKDLAEMASKLLNISCTELQTALIEREDLGSTAMGDGIAIPHARIEGIDSVSAIFVKLDEPVDFEASDRQGVDLVFCLFAPKDSGSDHLKALAKISRILRAPETRQKLRSAVDTDAIFAILVQPTDSVAA